MYARLSAYEFGEFLPFESGLSSDTVLSPDAGEPLLLARFAAGSVLGGAEVALIEGAIEANWRGEIMRSMLGASVVVATEAATAVDMVEI